MRAVFDLDDTISVHKNRDFANAVPIAGTVQKIRELKENGWEITIYSARGQNSCKGNLELIEQRNRAQVEKWLAEHDVPYDRLVFGKPLGDVYIDDKGVSLKKFLSDPYCELSGNSGAKIYRAGDVVLKSASDTQTQAEWYSQARSIGIKVPEIYSVVLGTMSMEYIDGVAGNNKALSRGDINAILAQIMLMSLHRAKSQFDVEGYRALIKARLAIQGWEREFDKLLGYIGGQAEYLRGHSSFSHGDLSLSNTIFTRDGIFLIDPSPRTEFSTYLNDFAKLRFSLDGGEQLLHGGDIPLEYEERLQELSEVLEENRYGEIVKAMEAVHWLRMLGYFKEPGEVQRIWEKAKALEAEL